MGETTTVAILAIAAVGLFLIYEQQQQQNAINQALLLRVATPPASNPLGSLASIAGPLIAALA